MHLKIREPGSAITHFIATVMALAAAIPLLVKASSFHGKGLLAMAIFIGSMICLYAASTTYHSVNVTGSRLKFFKKIDHMMIFVLIAGSYTPVCMMVLEHSMGYKLLLLIWAIAFGGMFIKFCWVTCPKWFSSIIYIAMGWLCIPVVRPLFQILPHAAFLWLLAGGIMYTVGGVIYALKLPIFNSLHKNFGSHEIFHVFVMAGSFCHFVFMYFYVL